MEIYFTMKESTLIYSIFLLLLTSCRIKASYFEPTGIIDRTIELSGKNVWISLNEKEKVDGYTKIDNWIYGGEIACNIEPLKNIDVKTFQVLPGTEYAKDKNNVYFPLETICIDYKDCGVCYFDQIIIEGANPKTFRYLGKEYATDDNLVFFRGVRLNGADGKTFKVIEGPEYFYFATDKNQVYKHNQVFSKADPSTFYYNKNDPRNKTSKSGEKLIIGDKNSEWEFIPPDQIRELVRQ